MKKFLFSLALLASSSFAANTYRQDRSYTRFTMDGTVGTFVFNSVTYGQIVGVDYLIVGDDGVGHQGTYAGHIDIPSGLAAFPTSANLDNRILTDASAKNAKSVIDAIIIRRAAVSSPSTVFANDFLSVSTAPITLP